MKSYLKILMLLLTGFNVSLIAQPDQNEAASVRANAKVLWSKPYEERTNSDIQKIIGSVGGGFYALRIRRSGALKNGNIKAIVEYYNQNMKLVRERELDLDYKGKDRYLKDVVMLKGQLWLLTYFYNEKHEKTYLFAQAIKNESLTLDRDIVKIAEQDKTNRERQDVFSYAISKDSSKFVVFTRQPDEKKRQQFSLTVYDQEFKEEWSKDATLPYGKSAFSIDEAQVDKAGNVYLLGVVYTDGGNRMSKRGKVNYQYSLLTYMRDSVIGMKEYKINPDGKFITDLTFRPTDDEILTFSGFYSEKGTASVKGACFFKINPYLGKMTDVATSEFSFDFLTKNLSERNKERAREAANRNDSKNEVELFNYNLDKLIPRSDGGAILIAEQYFIEERYNRNTAFANPYWGGLGWGGMGWYDPWYSPWGWSNGWYDPWGYRYGNRQADYYFNYNDIIVVNIKPDGEIQWSSRIPKRQISVNDGGIFSSYSMSTVADKLYFVYNEDPRNLDTRNKKYVADTPDKNSVVVLAEINRIGEVKIAPLFGNRNEGIVTRPKICRQIGKYEMAIYGESGRSYRFGTLGFE
jgi:hypothetical protein